jgi:hypothetical protein
MELLRKFPITPRHFVAFVAAFLRSFFVTKWYGGTVFAVGMGIIVASARRRRALLPLLLLVAFVMLYACHIRSYYQMESGHVEPQSALRFSMNFMALWAIMAGLGVGSIVTTIVGSPWGTRYKRLSTWSLGIAALGLLISGFVATTHLRGYEREDEAISRLEPALSAVRLVSHRGLQSDFIVTMEPLVVQMYANPQTQIVDLESVEQGDLEVMVSPSAASRLVFVRETDRLSADDLNRYGEPLRFLLSLPSTVLQSGDGFQIVVVQ